MRRYRLEAETIPDPKGSWVFADDVRELESKILTLQTSFLDMLKNKSQLVMESRLLSCEKERIGMNKIRLKNRNKLMSWKLR